MAGEFTAQMSVFKDRWRLYVVVFNTTEPWPTFHFDRPLPVPTITERSQALSVLGFEPLPGSEWSWIEDSEIIDDPSSLVRLIAAIKVRSWSGVGA
ncbi:DUF6303 family protein [Streptomyces violaceus]|uniref:DUF6303 family protein n=1 Tax=Streptomyces violaceus TaxID=1936 RepID=A0ABY9UKX1_STRVL|nr:DUF6303 family protein [Streptomyces janthinus]WND21472.1 DUF6303 family protein [Streptomyces janthinus]GGS45278.1 hypothetical protein GCM10010270_13920 [Streptomyces janthinus]